MGNVQDNIFVFSIGGIGIILLGLIFFSQIFDELQFFNLIIVLQQLHIESSSSIFNVIISLAQPPQNELNALIVFTIGIGLFFIATIYFLIKDFDWREKWKCCSLILLIISTIFAGIGLGIIVLKRELITTYVLLTLGLDLSGWLSYFLSPYNIIDAIIAVGIGISAIIINLFLMEIYSS